MLAHTPKAKLEVELPCRAVLWTLTILVRQGDPHLDDLQEIDITSHRLIMVLRGGFERANGSRYDAREFGVLCPKSVFV
jgi:hypothetical protein